MKEQDASCKYVFAEYIWIDGVSPTQTVRSKTKVIHNPTTPFDLPVWGFDGSSTSQAEGSASDCVLKPASVFSDPIRGGNHILVMCEVMNTDGTPHNTNHRANLRKLTDVIEGDVMDCWFGMEQEYTLFQGSSPLGFSGDRRFPAAQGPYYCGVGADQVFGRELAEAHLEACLEAGIKLSGINAEVMPGQWEFQVGPLGPLDVGDHLWVARWLLYRLGEEYRISATLDSKPVTGDWNGAGMHCNFSTPEMRSPTGEGMTAITEWCETASAHIDEHLETYGEGIEMRLTGKHETCRWDQFKWGVSDRTASVRIPLVTAQEGYGYLEDRRPNANACPYRVATAMLKTAYSWWR